MKIGYLEDEFFANNDRTNCLTENSRGSVSMGLTEIANTNKERLPYTESLLIDSSIVYIWTREFIYKCSWAMSTDEIPDMSKAELFIWEMFVVYEETGVAPAGYEDVMKSLDCVFMDMSEQIPYNEGKRTQGYLVDVQDLIEGFKL